MGKNFIFQPPTRLSPFPKRAPCMFVLVGFQCQHLANMKNHSSCQSKHLEETEKTKLDIGHHGRTLQFACRHACHRSTAIGNIMRECQKTWSLVHFRTHHEVKTHLKHFQVKPHFHQNSIHNSWGSILEG